MQVKPKYESKVISVNIELENVTECINFMYILNRAINYNPKSEIHGDGVSDLASSIYSQIYKNAKA